MFNLSRLHLFVLVTVLVNVALLTIFYSTKISIPRTTLQPIMAQIKNNSNITYHNIKSEQPPVRNFSKLMFDKEKFFIIEPAILEQTFGKKDEKSKKELDLLRERFNLPEFGASAEYRTNRDEITLGTFSKDIDNKLKYLIKNFNLLELVRSDAYVPFSNSSTTQLTHVFLNSPQQNLKLHIVIFYEVKHFLWIGRIPDLKMFRVNQFLNPRFGHFEAIYDPFDLQEIDNFQYPNDIGHFLTQIPTSRYLHCPEERKNWLTINNVTRSEAKVKASMNAIVSMKSLMKHLQMEFWMVCGTLLGWLRQCEVTPNTSDTDFATWSGYVRDGPITKLLNSTAPDHLLKLQYRLGESGHNLEYAFFTKPKSGNSERSDLFFIYSNRTNFLMSIHHPPKHRFAYLVYPQYSLCSVELLGYKLLAPCDPERVILAEYGLGWTQKAKDWDYVTSSLNRGPFFKWTHNSTQFESF